MSRIHEALLKAQKEHGGKSEGLEVETFEIPLPDTAMPVASEDVAADLTAPLVEGSSVVVGDDPPSFSQHSWNPDKEHLVSMRPEFSEGLEEFRTLSSRLLRERTQRHLKTVLITGAAPGEGKTFVTANLALAMARHPGSRVLVIDGDLRRSNLHIIFGMDPIPGLSGYLAGNLQPAQAVRQTPDPQLCIVTAGRFSDTPTELLHSDRMQKFIEAMSLQFDWIFIDSPPAPAVADSAVLSELCDGVVMVIAPGTSISAAQKCRDEIGHKILGIVLNRTENHAGYYSYYDYRQKPKKEKKGKETKQGKFANLKNSVLRKSEKKSKASR